MRRSVQRDAPFRVNEAQLKLRFDVAGFGRALIPNNSVSGALRINTLTARVKQSYSVWGFRVASRKLAACFQAAKRIQVSAAFHTQPYRA